MSFKTWDKHEGSPIGGIDGWMQAGTAANDGFIGGDEISGLCQKNFQLSSRCFTPKEGRRNRRSSIEERQTGGHTGWHGPIVGKGSERGTRKGWTPGDNWLWGGCPGS